MFDSLKLYFLSQDSSPKILFDLFQNATALLNVKFIQIMLKLLNNYIQKIEEENISAFELIN